MHSLIDRPGHHVHDNRDRRPNLIALAKQTLADYGEAWRNKTPAAPALSFQGRTLTKAEAGWLAALSLLAALLFLANKVMLLTEFNNWALVAYATDFIKAGTTEKFIIRLVNTPNVLFTFIYFYLRDVFPAVNSYTLYKLILLACIVSNIYLLLRLSAYKPIYIILVPVVFGYALVGGMTHYYLSLTLLFLLLLLYESKRDTPLKTFAIALLAYHAHFMGFFALMLLVLYKEGVRRTFFYSIIPFVLLVSYKSQYHNAYQIEFEYGFLNHFLSVRRMLLPSITDYNSTLSILIFSASLNFLFCAFAVYAVCAGYFVPQDRRAVLLILGLLAVYFLVPATLPGSGDDIHERLVIPFLAIFIHVAKERRLERWPVVLYAAAVLINIGICHHFYAIKGPDYRNPLLNKEPTGLWMNAAEDILSGKPVDLIDTELFTSGLVDKKR